MENKNSIKQKNINNTTKRINIKKFPYFSNAVVETTDWIFMSKYPSEPNSIFFKILPLLSTATEIPELADLRKKTDFSTDLKIWAARCCLGPVVFPNQASFVILIIIDDSSAPEVWKIAS